MPIPIAIMGFTSVSLYSSSSDEKKEDNSSSSGETQSGSDTSSDSSTNGDCNGDGVIEDVPDDGFEILPSIEDEESNGQ